MEYTVITIQEFLARPYLYCNELNTIWFAKKGKRKRAYLQMYCGFDIETYTTPSHYGYMYIWQFSLYGKTGNYIIIGRTWASFVSLINTLISELHLDKTRRIIIAVANLGFEHQFMKKHFIGRWTKVFAKEKRQPIIAIIDDCIEFRDVLMITGGSLNTLAKEYTKTQKLVGDLDYSIPRNCTTELTETELQYCYNDVAILSEYMEYLFYKYIIPEKYIPITKTGLLRREVKKAMGSRGNGVKREIMREIYRCYPATFELYSILMKWCFRGGYTHANIRHVGAVVDGVRSSDITSSYPYTMLSYDGFPVSPLRRENPSDFWKLFNDGKKCLMFSATFTNIRATTDHSIESFSKCLDISANRIIDNGRIRSATSMTVWLTELDFISYMLFYKWDSVVINHLYSSVKGRLPKYLLMPLARAYENKAKMKHEGKSGTTEYALYKSLVNSAYGMTVTRLVTSEVCMSDISCEWYLDESSFDYDKERKRAFLLPQWGIYVCAYSRYRILMAINSLGKDACYSDTDSIKYVGIHSDYFDAVNKKTRETMRDVCDLYGLDYNLFYDLGSFEEEYDGKPVQAKFLGAKRYIIKDDTGYHTKIAGLPKKSLNTLVDKLNLQHDMFDYGKRVNMFDVFESDMMLNCEVSLKNAHTYNDEIHQHNIDGVECMELSSVGIYPIDFTMKLSDYYLALISAESEEVKRYEDRIY